MKRQRINQNGITLIALVITIIVLLILAGVSISLVVGENGILKRAQESVKITKAKEIEEEIGLIYMDKKAEELTGGSKVTIETIVNDLREKDYTIEEKQAGKITVEEIEVNSNELTMEKRQNKNISYTLKTSIGEIQYFIEIQGEYHEISYDNSQVIISEEVTDINTLGQVDEKITVTSENTEMLVATLDENEKGKINLTSGSTGGVVKVTINEEKSGKNKEITVTVREPATSLALDRYSATLLMGQSLKLNATKLPENSTDNITWASSYTAYATVNSDGLVKAGDTEGTTPVYAYCGDLQQVCLVTCARHVNLMSELKKDLVGNGFSLISKSALCEFYNFNELHAGHGNGESWWDAHFKWEPKGLLDAATRMEVTFRMYGQHSGKYVSTAKGSFTVYYKDGTEASADMGYVTTGPEVSIVWEDFVLGLDLEKKPVNYVVFNLGGFNCDATGSEAMIKEITLSN